MATNAGATAQLVPTGPDAIVRAFELAAGLVLWWHHAGRVYYGKPTRRRRPRTRSQRFIGGFQPEDYDAGLEGLANEACRALGGWRSVRALLAQRPPPPRAVHRAIRLREREDTWTEPSTE